MMTKRIVALILAVLTLSMCTCTVIAAPKVPAEITSISTNAVLLLSIGGRYTYLSRSETAQ